MYYMNNGVSQTNQKFNLSKNLNYCYMRRQDFNYKLSQHKMRRQRYYAEDGIYYLKFRIYIKVYSIFQLCLFFQMT